MASFCLVVSRIMSLVSSDVDRWQIGATDDLEQAQSAAGRPKCFHSWQTDEPYEVHDLLAFFTKLGMRRIPAAKVESSRSVYVFVHKIRGQSCVECESLTYCRDIARYTLTGSLIR